MNCNCMEKLKKELLDKHKDKYQAVYGIFADIMTGKPPLPFKGVPHGTTSIHDMIGKAGDSRDFMISTNFCPMCGKMARFPDHDSIAKFQNRAGVVACKYLNTEGSNDTCGAPGMCNPLCADVLKHGGLNCCQEL